MLMTSIEYSLCI